MKFKDYTHVSDLNPRIVHLIANFAQWLFAIMFISCLINFFLEQNILYLIVSVFFLRWCVSTYQLMAIYDRCLQQDYLNAVDKEQKLYRSLGRKGRRKLGLKRIK